MSGQERVQTLPGLSLLTTQAGILSSRLTDKSDPTCVGVKGDGPVWPPSRVCPFDGPVLLLWVEWRPWRLIHDPGAGVRSSRTTNEPPPFLLKRKRLYSHGGKTGP